MVYKYISYYCTGFSIKPAGEQVAICCSLSSPSHYLMLLLMVTRMRLAIRLQLHPSIQSHIMEKWNCRITQQTGITVQINVLVEYRVMLWNTLIERTHGSVALQYYLKFNTITISFFLAKNKTQFREPVAKMRNELLVLYNYWQSICCKILLH